MLSIINKEEKQKKNPLEKVAQVMGVAQTLGNLTNTVTDLAKPKPKTNFSDSIRGKSLYQIMME